jgi:hypothetical protein
MLHACWSFVSCRNLHDQSLVSVNPPPEARGGLNFLATMLARAPAWLLNFSFSHHTVFENARGAHVVAQN